MKHYAGLDVSVKETSICIVDEAGKCLSRILFVVERGFLVCPARVGSEFYAWH